MTFAKCLCKLWKNKIKEFWHVIMTLVWCYIFKHIAKHINDILFRILCIYFYYKIKHSDMNIWINIFFEIRIFKSYPIWPNIMAIFVIKKWYSYSICLLISSSYIVTFALLYLPIAIGLINGRYAILFTWVVIIELVNTIWSDSTNPIIAIGNVVLPLSFLLAKTPPNPLPNCATNPISTPFLTTFMLGVTTVFQAYGC